MPRLVHVCTIDRKRHPVFTRRRDGRADRAFTRSSPWPWAVAWDMASALRVGGFRVWIEAPGAPAVEALEVRK